MRPSGRVQGHLASIAAVALALSGACAIVAGEPARDALVAYGKRLASECTSCHRSVGAGNGIPPITGMPEQTFTAAMGAYRHGQRHNPVMASVAQSLDEHQTSALAAYFATLPRPPRAPGPAASQTGGETGPGEAAGRR